MYIITSTRFHNILTHHPKQSPEIAPSSALERSHILALAISPGRVAGCIPLITWDVLPAWQTLLRVWGSAFGFYGGINGWPVEYPRGNHRTWWPLFRPLPPCGILRFFWTTVLWPASKKNLALSPTSFCLSHFTHWRDAKPHQHLEFPNPKRLSNTAGSQLLVITRPAFVQPVGVVGFGVPYKSIFWSVWGVILDLIFWTSLMN